MERDIDPDSPDFPQVIEELTRKEKERRNREVRELTPDLEDEPETRDAEALDEVKNVEIPGEELMEEDVAEQRAKKFSIENGRPEQPKTYDPVLGKIEELVGYNPDSAYPRIFGRVIEEDVNPEKVTAVYELEEPLIDTSGDQIVVPGIEFADKDYLNTALPSEGNLDIEIDNNGSYTAKVSYEGAESVEEGVHQVASTIAAIDNELGEAYNISR